MAQSSPLLKISMVLHGIQFLLIAGLAYVLFAIVLAEPAEVAGVTEATNPAQEEGDYRVEMRGFFERMTRILDRQARKQGVNPADVVPTQAQLDDAVETRTMHSDESQLVLQKLREGYEYFDLEWPVAIPER